MCREYSLIFLLHQMKTFAYVFKKIRTKVGILVG